MIRMAMKTICDEQKSHGTFLMIYLAITHTTRDSLELRGRSGYWSSSAYVRRRSLSVKDFVMGRQFRIYR
jgi:hypothetical protein